MSQNPDAKHHQPVRPIEALAVFEDILAQYDHREYYQREPPDTSESPQVMVPRAAVLAASILIGESNDGEKARKYVVQAMKDLQWTYRRRKLDWEATPKPVPNMFDDDDRLAKRVGAWQQRTREAVAGNVLGAQEMAIVNAAVRQYGLSFGPQHPDQVPAAMQQIIREFPDTPMAAAAQRHIDRSQRPVADALIAAPTTAPAAHRDPRLISAQPESAHPSLVSPPAHTAFTRTQEVLVGLACMALPVLLIAYARQRKKRLRK